MLNLAKFQISPISGFCPSSLIYSLPKLSAHVSVLKSRTWDISTLSSLPEYIPSSLLTPNEQEFAFLVHTMLNSIYYTQSKNNKIPPNLARPTIALSSALSRPPMLSLSSIQFHNWEYLTSSTEFHPDNLKTYFSFSLTRDEDYFFNVANYIEYLGAPAIKKIINFSNYLEDPDKFISALEDISNCIQKMIKAFDLLYQNIDPKVFYFGFRKYLKSFEQVSFEGTGRIFHGLMGASAVQSPIIKCLDAFVGVNRGTRFLKNTEEYMKKEHRHALEVIRSKDPGQIIEKSKYFNCKNSYNSVIKSLAEFRKSHIEVSNHFIIKQSNQDAVGTGGSSLAVFLERNLDRTKKLIID